MRELPGLHSAREGLNTLHESWAEVQTGEEVRLQAWLSLPLQFCFAILHPS